MKNRISRLKMIPLMVTSLIAFGGGLASAARADGISLGNPAYGGNGCPSGTASAVLSPDNTSLSILFDQYQAQAGQSSGLSMDRKSCNVAIPVHVPQGFSVSILKLDYRGFNSLPAGAYSMFNVEYFFAGSRGPSMRRTFMGALEQDYTITNRLVATGLVWSPCGVDVNLRANTSLFVRTNQNMEDAMSTVDSVDVNAALIYQLQWRRCS